jgi:hypothetical protein
MPLAPPAPPVLALSELSAQAVVTSAAAARAARSFAFIVPNRSFLSMQLRLHAADPAIRADAD